MLISKTVKMKWNSKNKKRFEELGYIYTKMGEEFEIKVEDLSYGSKALVDVKCDCENCKNPYLKPMKWSVYLTCVRKDGKYYCQKCFNKSFKQWCVENNRQDVLELWDCKLNDCSPNEIAYGTAKKYYFKCPKGLHESELKLIYSFTGGQEGSIQCNKCNSFAQWGIDNLGGDFLEKYWDYEKNTVNPWDISYGSKSKKVWIKCQEKDYHGSYDVSPNAFNKGNRCPYCTNNHGKVHLKDSLGQHIIDNYGEEFLNKVWSDKNNKTPFEYSPKSHEEVWWICIDGKHDDYYRNIGDSNTCEFRCPNCSFSKGEKRISYFLENNKIEYFLHKTFDGLYGVGNRNLSYDFYLENRNTLIEFNGIQHSEPTDFAGYGIEKAKENFKQQVEHDRRKRKYALDNNITIIEIWYWEFDDVERILSDILINKNMDNIHVIKSMKQMIINPVLLDGKSA